MKKDIVAACIFLLIILIMVLLCSCSSRGKFEGYATQDNIVTFARKYQGIGKITGNTFLTNEPNSVLFSTGRSNPSNQLESDSDSDFCAIIDGTALKIAKRTTESRDADLTSANAAKQKAISDKAAADAAKAAIDLNSADALSQTQAADLIISAAAQAITNADIAIGAVQSTPSTWTVVWDSSLSGYSGSPQLKLVNGLLMFGDANLSDEVSGSYVKLTTEGDLILCNSNGVTAWSLIAHELDAINNWLSAYFRRGSRIYRAVEYEDINRQYDNFKTYIDKVNKNTPELQITYDKLKKLRHQLDFEIGELNGLSNSKVDVSNQTLEYSMYLNLGITVLAASLFILIVTR